MNCPQLAVAACAALSASLSVNGQGSQSSSSPNMDPPPSGLEAPIFEVSAGYEFRTETSINGGGDVEMTRYEFGFAMGQKLDDERRLGLAVVFRDDDYNFKGTTGLGGPNPWGDIFTLSAALTMSHRVNNDWAYYYGGVFMASWEDGVDFDDGISAGGFAGARYRFSDDLAIGFGAGVVSQIEEDARFFPAFSVDWTIDDNWRLTTDIGTTGGRLLNPLKGAPGSGGGLEVVYDFHNGWEAGLGAAYETNRFRLDSTGIAPNGVGESTQGSIWLRASYSNVPDTAINFFLGTCSGGEFELDDDTGTSITDKDFDDALFIGAAIQFKF